MNPAAGVEGRQAVNVVAKPISAPDASHMKLRGRYRECETLSSLADAARAGRSSALVMTGEAGVGKTALVDYMTTVCAQCRVLRVTGVESQMELAFAGLHELCGPLLGNLGRLPDPQADALTTAFGLARGTPPDRFLIGLAVLTLLSESARERPLVCLIDDAQWLDRATVQTLTFVARRLDAESVVLLVATRPEIDDEEWAGLPRLGLEGIPEDEAGALLDRVIPGALDPRVRSRIVAETRGNPLALLMLPRWFSLTELTFGPQPSSTSNVQHRLEEGFRRQLEPMPEECRRLLVIAAAEPTGDVALLWRAADLLGLGPEAAVPSEDAGLIELRELVRFRHPLLRSVAYRAASLPERQVAHRALATVTDAALDAERCAWHRAHAATEPDESLATELERCAERAIAHGGLLAAGEFLRRSSLLTPDRGERTRRELEAAQAMLHAGSFDAALHMLALAQHGPLDALQRARVDLLRAQIWFATRRGDDALPLLAAAARQLESLDVQLALDSHLDALTAALLAGRTATDPGPADVGRAARRAPMLETPRRADLLLHAVSVRFADGYAPAVPIFREAMAAFDTNDVSLHEGVRLMWLAAVGAVDTWDYDAWDRLTRRHLDIVRGAGALSALPAALAMRVFAHLFAGDIAAASAMVQDFDVVVHAADSSTTDYGAIGLAAFRGHEDASGRTLSAALSHTSTRGEGIGMTVTLWAQAMLCNGLGRYAEALEAARAACLTQSDMGVLNWALAELVEAAIRAGDLPTALEAHERLSARALASGTDWALGVRARCAAQLSAANPTDAADVEGQYREAVARLRSTRLRVELARAELVYGEWLRRGGRRIDAREHLRAAHVSFTAMGIDAFAERARRELAATGETVRKRSADTRLELTAQELHIARLAADGLTNPEIAAQLFISPRTVEWHLRKVFAKLGVTARRHLREVLKGTSR